MFSRKPQETTFLTVVTYGRTGSTALQAALNSLPGVLVRGENYAALRGLQQYVQSVAETADRHHNGLPTHPWYGSKKLDPAAVIEDLRRHVVENLLRPEKDTTVLGFKEVRYEPGHFEHYELLLSYLLFLNTLFPGITYIINVRDPQEAARSGWWPNHGDPVAALTQTRDWLVSAHEDLNSILGEGRAVLLHYEDWQGNAPALIGSFKALYLPGNDAGVRAALSQQLDHGSHGHDESQVDESQVDENGSREPR
ncbi:MAG: sulfotransferase [Actinomycetota bacterium]|nr:sulfotransferase [Actinomycetota bacterium]